MLFVMQKKKESPNQLVFLGIVSVENVKRLKMDLLECSTPVENPTSITAILKTNDLPFPVPDTDDHWKYNCWGYVAFHCGWEKHPRWVSGEMMEQYLSENTMPVDKNDVQFGDIAVFRTSGLFGGALTHTALVTHEIDIICHKPGANPLCVDSMKRAKGMYPGEVSYVREI